MEKTVANFQVTVDGTTYDVHETTENLNSYFYVTVLGRELRFEGDENGELRPKQPYTIDEDLICGIANEIENWCDRQ